MGRFAKFLGVLLITASFGIGCAGTTVVRTAPPDPKVETKPARPGPKAVWVDGHWQWNGNRYVWKSGHWVKNPKGTWIAGHWTKRRGGYVWVTGHWKR